MHTGDAIIALLLGLSIAGYAYRAELLQLDTWMLRKQRDMIAWLKKSRIKAYLYRGRHHIDTKQLQCANFTNTIGVVERRVFHADQKGRIIAWA